ncbi:hypothetical protein O181_110819, partial [Austropuccinia psidii MF-1]|nr:hypothetical protein [Austropuccinia psidii MF-1]
MAFLGHLGPLRLLRPVGRNSRSAVGQKPFGHQNGHRTRSTQFWPWPLEGTRGHPTSSASTPLNSRGILSISPCTPYSRLQEWCIYGIIYHYAPFLLINSMVKLSGPNFTIPNQGPKSNAHLKGGFFNSSVWQSMAAIRRPFKDPNHLALQELGWQFHSWTVPRAFSEAIQSFNHLSRHQVFQYSLDNSIGPYR